MEASVGLHWDKDEHLRATTADVSHPLLSTVTYLCSSGAPTIVFDHCIDGKSSNAVPDPDGGSDIHSSAESKAATTASATNASIHNLFLSWPRVSKHIAFDGRLLHGAPGELAAEELERAAFGNENAGEEEEDEEEMSERVTFLVNIWLDHKPQSVHEFPAEDLPSLARCSRAVLGDLPPKAPDSISHFRVERGSGGTTSACDGTDEPVLLATSRDLVCLIQETSGTSAAVYLPEAFRNPTFVKENHATALVLGAGCEASVTSV